MQETQETRIWSFGQARSPGGANGNPLQYSGLENPTSRGACQITAHGVAKRRTWLSRAQHSSHALYPPELSQDTASSPKLLPLLAPWRIWVQPILVPPTPGTSFITINPCYRKLLVTSRMPCHILTFAQAVLSVWKALCLLPLPSSAAMKLKDTWKKSYEKPGQCIKSRGITLPT